jgi:hypothetical protein
LQGREQSWQVQGVARALLRQVTSLGYVVSVHRIPTSLLGSVPAFVEMHAIDLSIDPPAQYVARVFETEAGDIDYRCACLLAQQAGIVLDG